MLFGCLMYNPLIDGTSSHLLCCFINLLVHDGLFFYYESFTHVSLPYFLFVLYFLYMWAVKVSVMQVTFQPLKRTLPLGL